MREQLAIWMGRAAGSLSRRLGRGGGTTVPGRVARRIAPAVLTHLTQRLPQGVIVVAGTNGKTTTTRMIASLLRAAGWRVLHNRSGANLVSGVTATIIDGVRWNGALPYDAALLECDEAALPQIILEVEPRLVVLHYFFRDQLDRYGEVDTIAANWRDALVTLPVSTVVLLNGDDPSLARLGSELHCTVVSYGNDDLQSARGSVEHLADAGFCRCGNALAYRVRFFGHIGHYSCSACGFARPDAAYALVDVAPQALRGSALTLQLPGSTLHATLPMPGLYNAMNALAAVATTDILGLTPPYADVFAQFQAAFGRYEVVQTPRHTLVLALIKNPIGASETLRMLAEAWHSQVPMLVIINDRDADGTDVSWLWDADFELLPDHVAHVTVSGTRAADMHVRLKYAGVSADRITTVADITAALDATLADLPEGTTLYVLPTYTAMLEIRAVLVARGWAQPFWND